MQENIALVVYPWVVHDLLYRPISLVQACAYEGSALEVHISGALRENTSYVLEWKVGVSLQDIGIRNVENSYHTGTHTFLQTSGKQRRLRLRSCRCGPVATKFLSPCSRTVTMHMRTQWRGETTNLWARRKYCCQQYGSMWFVGDTCSAGEDSPRACSDGATAAHGGSGDLVWKRFRLTDAACTGATTGAGSALASSIPTFEYDGEGRRCQAAGDRGTDTDTDTDTETDTDVASPTRAGKQLLNRLEPARGATNAEVLAGHGGGGGVSGGTKRNREREGEGWGGSAGRGVAALHDLDNSDLAKGHSHIAILIAGPSSPPNPSLLSCPPSLSPLPLPLPSPSLALTGRLGVKTSRAV